MKAVELMEELFSAAPERLTETIDTFKAGDAEREVHRVATCFIATPEVIRRAADWGADLLITHEPTFYDHRDFGGKLPEDPVIRRKKALLDESGLAVCRLHDHMHAARPDGIIQGQLDALNWDCDYDGEFSVQLRRSRTAREIAGELKEKWGLECVRRVGALDVPMKGVYLMIGAFGEDRHMQALAREDCQVLVVGETCEWRVGEYVRDAAQLGFSKALLVCGHVGSERLGMKALCGQIAQRHPEMECTYLECGEVYSY